MRTSRTNEANEANGIDAIVAARSASGPVETDEIEALASAAGYEVVDAVTQVGPEDPGTHFGSGKAAELAARAADLGAGTVVVDGSLTPGQHHALERRLPDGTRLLDRYRLVLGIFERGAGSRRARLQVELARLRYDLPRLIESADEGLLNEVTESGTPVYDVRDRIDRLERTLDDLPDPTEQFRRRRREQGFDLVTLAGYTNAGKSTLLRRLADDVSFADGDAAAGGATAGADAVSGKDAAASVADRLFETLETTTRRATLEGRPTLVTDTVGFVDDLPHDLVRSFSATLSEAGAADVVVLVADASDPVETFRERLAVSLDALAEQGVEDERIVPALNKVDLLGADERARRVALAEDRAPASAAAPIPVSVREGTNLGALVDAVLNRLPTDRATIRLPNCDEAMRVVSRAYDRTAVDDVDYAGDAVTLRCRGRPSVLERLRASARGIDG
ncbi:GTPase HflX [Salinilacihabitans rarus]|uniref:GTPase HflX n=1 Tax=Salinilacihabitans rarus TaxID=2961596 RepID=UPI0020C91303|nr:GTPase HflX [Salinilacihabitans rarus]